MRTLKKALSLVLCVVMVMGLFAFSVSAKSVYDYTDSKDIKYTEAAEVLSALGVINGKDDGTYDPKGELTRGEAAIIITRLLNVNPAGKSTFTDIRDPFYDPYIGYLQAQGFVNGYGDGRFGPDDKLTGSAFGKMLLVALGYNAETENMSGAQWEIGVAKLLKSTNITGKIVPFDQTAIVTREIAAQMSLNALKADMVEYPNNGVQVHTSDGTEVKVNQGKYETKKSTNNRYGNIKNDPDVNENYICQLGEDAWEGLKLTDKNETDDLGRPINKWELNGNSIVDAPKAPVASIYSGTTEDKIHDALRSYKILVYSNANNTYKIESITKNSNLDLDMEMLVFDSEMKYAYNGYTALGAYANYSGISFSKDGEKKHVYESVEDMDLTKVKAGESIAKRMAEILAKDREGALVEFYANNDNYITNIVVTQYKVAEVTNVTTASNGDIIYTINGRTMRDYADPTAKDTVIVTGTLNAGDFVTMVRPGTSSDTVSYVFPTEKITGVQTATDKKSKITVDGNTLTVARGVEGLDGGLLVDEMTEGAMFGNSSSSRNFYRDQFGYVVHAEEGTSEINDYAIVDKISYDAGGGLDSETVKAVLYFVDGSSRTVQVDKINGVEVKKANMSLLSGADTNGNWLTVGQATAISNGIIDLRKSTDLNLIYEHKLVSYSVKSNGHYEIKYGPGVQDTSLSYDQFDNVSSSTYQDIYTAAFNAYYGLEPAANLGSPARNITDNSNLARFVYTVPSADPETLWWLTAGQDYDIVTKGAPSVKTARGNINTNDNTVFVVRGKGTGDYNVYTGFRSVPTIKARNYSPAFFNISYVMENGKVRLVFIDAVNQKVTTSSKDIFFATTKDWIEERVDGNTLYKLDGILNGEKTTLVTDKNGILNRGDNWIDKGYVFSVEFTNNNYVDKMVKLTSGKGIITTRTLDDENNLDDSNDPILAYAGIADSNATKSISSGSYEGFTWTNNTKVVVIDDGNLVEGGAMNSIGVGDAVYIQTVGNTSSNADNSTIKLVYIDKNIGATLDGQATTTRVADELEKKSVLTFSQMLYFTTPTMEIANGQVVTLNGGIDFTGASTSAARPAITVQAGGKLVIKGDIYEDADKYIDVYGELEIIPNNADWIQAHINVLESNDPIYGIPLSGVLTIRNTTRNGQTIIDGDSIAVDGGIVNIKVPNTVLAGNMNVYSNAYDTTAVSIEGNLQVIDGGKLVVSGSSWDAPVVTITGDLNVATGGSVNVYSATFDSNVEPIAITVGRTVEGLTLAGTVNEPYILADEVLKYIGNAR